MSDWLVPEWLALLVEWAVLVLCGVNAGLLLRFYTSHRTGTMPLAAALGSGLLLIGVAWNSAHFTGPKHPGLLPGSVLILIGLLVMLLANLRVMRFTWHRHRGED